ncbi:MAG: hypothetical protein V1855_01245 [bacterium]
MKKLAFLFFSFFLSNAFVVAAQSIQERYQTLFEQWEQRRTQGAPEQELAQLKAELDGLLEQMGQSRNLQPVHATINIVEQEFASFKTWAEKTIFSGEQQSIIQDFEHLMLDAKEHAAQLSEQNIVQCNALYNAFTGIKQARLKLELLRVGSFFSNKTNTIVDVPLSDVLHSTILKSVIKTVSDQLHQRWNNARALQAMQAQTWTQALVSKEIIHNLPNWMHISWVCRIIRLCIPGAKKVQLYNLLAYDLYAQHTLLCNDIVKALNAYDLCVYDNSAARETCYQDLCTASTRLEQQQKQLEKIQLKSFSDAQAHAAITILMQRIDSLKKKILDYKKPGWSAASQDATLAMHDRLQLFFCEYQTLRNKNLTALFIRYNQLLNQYRQTILNGEKHSEKFFQEIHTFVIKVRQHHPGFIPSLVWSNRTQVYFLDLMIQILESIDPRIKEPTIIDHVIQKVMLSNQGGLTGKIVKNVLGSEVVTDIVLKQLKRVVEFLQNQQKPSS